MTAVGILAAPPTSASRRVGCGRKIRGHPLFGSATTHVTLLRQVGIYGTLGLIGKLGDKAEEPEVVAS